MLAEIMKNMLLARGKKQFVPVGGLEHDFIFPYIGNFIIPTDELIFLRGVGMPPTSVHSCKYKYPLVLETSKLGEYTSLPCLSYRRC